MPISRHRTQHGLKPTQHSRDAAYLSTKMFSVGNCDKYPTVQGPENDEAGGAARNSDSQTGDFIN